MEAALEGEDPAAAGAVAPREVQGLLVGLGASVGQADVIEPRGGDLEQEIGQGLERRGGLGRGGVMGRDQEGVEVPFVQRRLHATRPEARRQRGDLARGVDDLDRVVIDRAQVGALAPAQVDHDVLLLAGDEVTTVEAIQPAGRLGQRAGGGDADAGGRHQQEGLGIALEQRRQEAQERILERLGVALERQVDRLAFDLQPGRAGALGAEGGVHRPPGHAHLGQAREGQADGVRPHVEAQAEALGDLFEAVLGLEAGEDVQAISPRGRSPSSRSRPAWGVRSPSGARMTATG